MGPINHRRPRMLAIYDQAANFNRSAFAGPIAPVPLDCQGWWFSRNRLKWAKNLLAEREGFEPPVRFPVHLISSSLPLPSHYLTTDGNKQSSQASRFCLCRSTTTTAVLGQNTNSAKALGT